MTMRWVLAMREDWQHATGFVARAVFVHPLDFIEFQARGAFAAAQNERVPGCIPIPHVHGLAWYADPLIPKSGATFWQEEYRRIVERPSNLVVMKRSLAIV